MTILRSGVKAISGKLRYSDVGAKRLFALPKTALLLKIFTDVHTAFDDSGTDYLDIGTVDDPAKFVNNADLATADLTEETLLVGGNLAARGLVKGPVLEVYGTYAGQNGNAAAGVVEVVALYIDLAHT